MMTPIKWGFVLGNDLSMLEVRAGRLARWGWEK